MNNIGVYKITCLITNLIYVGYSTNLKNREQIYSQNQAKNQLKITESIKNHRWTNHKFEIIEYCDEKFLRKKEKFWIKKYDSFNNGLNMNEGGGGVINHSEKTKKIIGEKRKGWMPSLERGLQIGNKLKGIPKSEEHKQKIREGNLGKSKNKGRKSPNEGNKYSDETKKVISFILTGKFRNEITKQKIRENQWKNKTVLQYDKQGNLIKEYYSASEAARQLGKKATTISNAAKGGQKTGYGYIWKYKDLCDKNVVS